MHPFRDNINRFIYGICQPSNKSIKITVVIYGVLHYPCRIELTGEALVITRIKPETTVTLPVSQIKAFSAMEEENYMLHYHGEAENTSKAKGIKKYYLVVDYISKNGEEKRLAFWGTAAEYGKFIEFQHMTLNGETNYSL